MSLKNLSVKTKVHKNLRNKLTNKRINLIYKRFEKSLNIKENFAVAVSGGPDSLSLAFLAKVYSLKNKLKIKYFIVDHRLRKESTDEAIKVKKILKKFSINLEILTWRGKKPLKNIQALSRKKRYDLLFLECDKYKLNNILLGHHQNDLFENFFIRILRGSGLKGLISLNKKTMINNKNLFRPLLDQKKEDLIFLSKNIFNFYVKDPTNDNEKYQRIKVRKLIEELQKNGLDKRKFFKTIENLKSSNSVVDYYAKENLKKNAFFSEKDKKLILNKNFFVQPYEVIFRCLSDSIKLVGQNYYPTRGKKLEKIIKVMENDEPFKVTLGGCIIEKVNHSIIITKEH
jgi:tRNA(Ile)-lysidine synthase